MPAIKDVEVTIKEGVEPVDRVKIAKWILEYSTTVANAKEAMMIATDLFNGKTWEQSIWSLRNGFDKCPYFDIKNRYEEEANEHKVWFARQNELFELCRKGAEGDAEAAIAYCKAEMTGEVNHGAFAC